MRRSGAQVVVCPQATVAAVLSEARRRGELDIPVVSVLTDYGVHPFWADPPADLILAPDDTAVDALAALGVPRERLQSTGIPIHPAFQSRPSREEARRALALPSAAPVALLSGGERDLAHRSRGRRPPGRKPARTPADPVRRQRPASCRALLSPRGGRASARVWAAAAGTCRGHDGGGRHSYRQAWRAQRGREPRFGTAHGINQSFTGPGGGQRQAPNSRRRRD